jgi:glucose-fructose oxidoreductase
MNSPRSASLPRRQFISQLALGAGALALAARAHGQSSAAPRKLGVALAGLGNYSTRQLAPALKLTQHCRLTGVVTGSPEKGRQWARDHGFPEKNVYHYDTMAQMAENPDIDIVYVVTPNALHERDVVAAARAGKHVICEKPMAVSVAECDRMIAACTAAKVRLSMGYRLHFDPIHEELRRLVRSEEFGPFLKSDGAFAFPMNKPQWRAEKALAGGGPLMDVGVYVIQQACMATGQAPSAVTARELPKKRPEFFRDVEESLEWSLEFPNGARSTGFTGYDSGTNRFRAEAAKGWFELSPAYSYSGIKANSSRGPVTVAPAASQQALQMDDFAQCILEQRASRVPGEMGRRDMVIVEGIYASAAAGGQRRELKY